MNLHRSFCSGLLIITGFREQTQCTREELAGLCFVRSKQLRTTELSNLALRPIWLNVGAACMLVYRNIERQRLRASSAAAAAAAEAMNRFREHFAQCSCHISDSVTSATPYSDTTHRRHRHQSNMTDL